METIANALTLWLGGMFIYASTLKFANYEHAASIVRPYAIVPARIAAPIGRVLPWLELTAGVTLLLGTRPIAPLLAVVLGAGFTAATTSVLLRRRSVPCGCTASRIEIVSRGTLIRAVAITLAASMLAVVPDDNVPPMAALFVGALAAAPGLWVARTRGGPARAHAHAHTRVEVRPEDLAAARALLARSPAAPADTPA